jgi:hypothetical protein
MDESLAPFISAASETALELSRHGEPSIPPQLIRQHLREGRTQWTRARAASLLAAFLFVATSAFGVAKVANFDFAANLFASLSKETGKHIAVVRLERIMKPENDTRTRALWSIANRTGRFDMLWLTRPAPGFVLHGKTSTGKRTYIVVTTASKSIFPTGYYGVLLPTDRLMRHPIFAFERVGPEDVNVECDDACNKTVMSALLIQAKGIVRRWNGRL